MVVGLQCWRCSCIGFGSENASCARLHHFAFCLLPFGAEFGSFPDDGDDNNNNNRRQEVFGAYAFETAIRVCYRHGACMKRECGKRVEQTINKFQLIVDIVMAMLWSAKMKWSNAAFSSNGLQYYCQLRVCGRDDDVGTAKRSKYYYTYDCDYKKLNDYPAPVAGFRLHTTPFDRAQNRTIFLQFFFSFLHIFVFICSCRRSICARDTRVKRCYIHSIPPMMIFSPSLIHRSQVLFGILICPHAE